MLKRNPIFIRFLAIMVIIIMLAAMSLLTAGCSGEKVDSNIAGTSQASSLASDPTSTNDASSSLNIASTTNSNTDAVGVNEQKKISVDELISKMTLEEKVGQMIQADTNSIDPSDVSKYFIGSLLSSGDSIPGNGTQADWQEMTSKFMNASSKTRLGIPLLLGVDAVHGLNLSEEAVVFPHNIGLGAANDPALMNEIGLNVGHEVSLTGANWVFAPVVASALDIRWGRTYESYSENPAIVSALSVPYIEGLQQNGITATAKHFILDGATNFVQRRSYMLDQGNATMSEKDLRSKYLPAYANAVKAGVKSIMVSFSSWNGLKMHENKYLVTDVLKGELGFKGLVVTDYEALHQVSRPNDLHSQMVKVVNAGSDILMEPSHWRECAEELKKAVKAGEIKQERIDDAVRRILSVKVEMGLFKDSNKANTAAVGADSKLGSAKIHEIAAKAVRESLVLLKNNNNLLPLKKNAKIFITGPAADNIGVQCGGWTLKWQGGMDLAPDQRWINGTSILDGFRSIAEQNGGTIITDVSTAKSADVAIVVLGEQPYSEGVGDDATLSLFDGMALGDNEKALKEAYETGLPVAVVLVSGRPRIVTNEIEKWNAFVEAWLPGTEGGEISRALYGDYNFKGKLPFTWPSGTEQLPINYDNIGNRKPLFPIGFGLQY